MFVIVIVLICLVGCIYIEPPQLPKVPSAGSPSSPVGPPGFDYGTAIAYIASIVTGIIAFIRWVIIEFKHKQLLAKGKKDANRDGEEDKE